MAETERDALFQVLDALETLEVPYMVVGSFAYLDRWVHTLGIADRLERVRQEVARPPDAQPAGHRLLKLARTTSPSTAPAQVSRICQGVAD